MCVLITFCVINIVVLCTFNRGTECVKNGTDVLVVGGSGGVVRVVQMFWVVLVGCSGGGGAVVLWYGCSGGGGGSVGSGGVVRTYYLVNPVVAVGLGMSFSVFPCLGLGLGLQVDSPCRIPTNSQVILSGHLSMSTLSSYIFAVRIYFRSPTQ